MRKLIVLFAMVAGLVGYFAYAWYDSECAHFEREQVVSSMWQHDKLLRELLIESQRAGSKSDLVKAIRTIQMKESPSISIIERNNEVIYSGLRFTFVGEKLSKISTGDDEFFEE